MIGAYIRQLREEKGYLLRQMSALLNINPTILSKIERGEQLFKRENILKVAETCEIDKDELPKQWLADRICEIVKDKDFAEESLKMALDRINVL